MSSEEIEKQVLRETLRPLHQKMRFLGWAWVIVLILISAVGVYAYSRQLRKGLVVTGMRDYVSWGVYISQFVFLVAVSLVGALFSSILRLTNFEFRRPLTRVAEFIAVAAIVFAAISIIVDMGRPDRLLSVITGGRIQSPIIWDVLVLNTYLVISCLLLYAPLIPDLAYCRDHLKDIPRWRRTMYRVLALGWQDTPRQNELLHKTETILVVLILPAAVGIHTVTSWLFAMTYRPGWDSTVFGPYFVSGAFVVGVACVILGISVFRNRYSLQNYITEKHFDFLGKLLVLTALVYLYFNINEFLVPGFKMRKEEATHFEAILTGEFSAMFWGGVLLAVVLPTFLPILRFGRKPGVLAGLALLVIIGHWMKRYAIVIPTLAHPLVPIQLVPPAWEHYVLSWEEAAITAGILAGTLLTITIMSRLFPVVPIKDILAGTFSTKKGEGETPVITYELNAIKERGDDHA
ncbi:MAG: NrfD/PsrC family molybdoenzyme membrane anchor subunit [Bradymonadaceae bacterium]